jgi:hypothetical protein
LPLKAPERRFSSTVETIGHGKGTIAGFWKLRRVDGRHLDLAEVVGNIAGSLQLAATRWDDEASGEAGSMEPGREASDWSLVAKHPDVLKAASSQGLGKFLGGMTGAQIPPSWRNPAADPAG